MWTVEQDSVYSSITFNLLIRLLIILQLFNAFSSLPWLTNNSYKLFIFFLYSLFVFFLKTVLKSSIHSLKPFTPTYCLVVVLKYWIKKNSNHGIEYATLILFWFAFSINLSKSLFWSLSITIQASFKPALFFLSSIAFLMMLFNGILLRTWISIFCFNS